MDARDKAVIALAERLFVATHQNNVARGQALAEDPLRLQAWVNHAFRLAKGFYGEVELRGLWPRKPSMPEDSIVVALSELTTRARSTLRRAVNGVMSWEGVAEISLQDLMWARGCGTLTLTEIMAWTAKHGVTLKGE